MAEKEKKSTSPYSKINARLDALEKAEVPEFEMPEINVDEIVLKVKKSIDTELAKAFEYVNDKLDTVEQLISKVAGLHLEVENIKSLYGRKEGVAPNEFFGGDEEPMDAIFEHAGEAPVDEGGQPLPEVKLTLKTKELLKPFTVP